jgi:hypothetical protein
MQNRALHEVPLLVVVHVPRLPAITCRLCLCRTAQNEVERCREILRRIELVRTNRRAAGPRQWDNRSWERPPLGKPRPRASLAVQPAQRKTVGMAAAAA